MLISRFARYWAWLRFLDLCLATARRLAASHASQGAAAAAIEAIVVVRWVDSGSIRVEVVHAVEIVASRGPPEAVATLIVRRAIVEVARERQTKSGAVICVSGSVTS